MEGENSLVWCLGVVPLGDVTFPSRQMTHRKVVAVSTERVIESCFRGNAIVSVALFSLSLNDYNMKEASEFTASVELFFDWVHCYRTGCEHCRSKAKETLRFS